jgi:predicted acetyltransferase
MIRLHDASSEPRLRAWLERAYPLYLHELSEFSSEYHLNEHGLFEPDYLPYWLGEAHAHPLVLLDAEAPFGFACVGTKPFPYMSADVDQRMAGFFVTREKRGTGAAEEAAREVLRAFPGRWEITELPRNQRAVRFWRRVVARLSGGAFEETADDEQVRQTFRA